MTPEELVSSIADVGVLTCIAALFLYACFRAVKSFFDSKDAKMNINKKKNKRDKAVLEDEENMLVPDKKSREAHDEAMNMRYKIGVEVQYLLDHYLDHFDCESIHVVEFGNSQINLGYLPFRYMTCTYESCKLGVRGIGPKIDKLSTSLFTTFFTRLDENTWCIYSMDNPEEICGTMRDWMEDNKQSSALHCAIRTHTGKFIGYVTITNKQKYTDEDIEDIQSLAEQLSALIGILDK